jgi:hypothetical protein
VPFGSSKWEGGSRAVEATFVVCCASLLQPQKDLKSQQKGNTEPSSTVDADDVVDDELKETGLAANQSIRGQGWWVKKKLGTWP